MIPCATSGVSSMNHDRHSAADQQLSKALSKMLEALRMLDEAGAPGEIGSALDLSIARLEQRLGVSSQLGGAAERLFADLEPGATTEDEEPASRGVRILSR